MLSLLGLWLLAAIVAAKATSRETFHESLTLHPLPDGKLSVSFEFTTHFTLSSTKGSLPQSHHSLTPPSLLLPLERNNVSELTISFVSGRWSDRSSESGPLNYQASGGGGEVRGWLRDGNEDKWIAVTHALGGLFCAGLGPNNPGESITTLGSIYPPINPSSDNLTHYLLTHPHLPLCTENLTPFLSLLPSKGVSGLSHLLSKPGTVFSWGYKTEGIEVLMPSNPGGQGRWRGWWEGVVDLPSSGGRDFSLDKVFGRGLPKAFPLAETSVLRIVNRTGLKWDSQVGDGLEKSEWMDGKLREVVSWDLKNDGIQDKDIKFFWDETFRYPPLISVTRTVGSRLASDGTFLIRIENNSDRDRPAVYTEIWPWWVKGWMSEIRLSTEDDTRPDLLLNLEYNPSLPPKISTTTLHLHLTIPAETTLLLEIPFTKLTLKYTEHQPDAERGIELPSSILTLLDQSGDSSARTSGDTMDVRKSSRHRIYTSKLLLDLPTPDFSMPYNVIIMSSTVMAVCFTMVQGALGRRWGWVEVGPVVRGKVE